MSNHTTEGTKRADISRNTLYQRYKIRHVSPCEMQDHCRNFEAQKMCKELDRAPGRGSKSDRIYCGYLGEELKSEVISHRRLLPIRHEECLEEFGKKALPPRFKG